MRRQVFTTFVWFFLALFPLLPPAEVGAAGTPQAEDETSGVVAIDPEASPPLIHEETPRFSWGTKLNLDFRLRDISPSRA